MDKLDEHGAEFQKLVSVATDGAANMVGKYSGMTACLKRLVQQRCATGRIPYNEFHSVWCFAHLLNLVTRDFMDLKGVNIVKVFADWLSDRRRQVSYKTFCHERTQETNSEVSRSHLTRDGFSIETLFRQFYSKVNMLKSF